ncbi:MAG: hypothetical protein LQ344_003034 [Seirophora lacunosa]|nr:MAG: hypothetical protein LQ344_003034 [Seirophora lacunosa]
MDPAQPENKLLRNVSNVTTKGSFLERRLSILTTSRSTTEPGDQLRGPLGLNLLYEPLEPIVDFIFVHGLRGGSRKTWSASDDPSHFWPKEWLPTDPRFKHVRLHSFGYNADWGEKKGSVLNIHDFGRGLLGDIHTSPYIRNSTGVSCERAHERKVELRSCQNPIVFVGHSMGGLVIKKACILAKHDPNFKELASRFHSIYFLATPHRGADNAQLLNRILKASVAFNAKDYVNDLIPNSGAIQAINDDFRHIFHDLQLWSFYETVKTNLGVSQGLIVEKDSAALGLPQERVQLLNADHRHVCKFKDASDNNYLSLRNAFVLTIDQIEKKWLALSRDGFHDTMRTLASYLGQSDMPDNDLSNLLDRQMEGTCEWFTSDAQYKIWRAGIGGVPKLLWLSGKPATGKSTLAAHVVRQICESNLGCSYFFFKHGDKSKSTVASMLRSFAYQMASTNPQIRAEIASMHENGTSIDADDERTLWRSIFISRVFRTNFHRPYFWVIDALDECGDFSCFLPMLAKIDKSIPLQVFVTSRPSSVIQTLLLQEKLPAIAKEMTAESSSGDIRGVLEANTRFLPIDDPAACQRLIERILEKSNGCFLWASLVLKELETTHSEQQIQEVLDSVPSEMDDLYTRILQNMAMVPRNQKLAQAIVRWTVCAVRPLTVEELKEAIWLDLEEVVPRLERTVESVCGHLIHVDRQARVQLVHESVRAFLIKDGLASDFAVDRIREHSRVAEVCLQYLCSDELRSSRFRRRGSATRAAKRSAVAHYACVHFSEHVLRSSSSNDSQVIALNTFFSTNILTWIEAVAQGGNLYFLTQTAKNLKAYMERRAKYRSPLGHQVHVVNSWINDLIHVVTTFGRSLLLSPPSIHFLVPPVCPRSSIIYQQYREYPRCLEIVGRAELDWDDRLSCITFSECKALAVACRDSRFAVGLSNGHVVLYHTSTCQEAGQLVHGNDAVRFLEFGSTNALLASAGRQNIIVWDIGAGTRLWATTVTHRLLALGFNEDDTILMATTIANYTTFWMVGTGQELEKLFISDVDEDASDTYQRPPTHAQICGELNLLAVGYRQRPINMWDLENRAFIGQFHKSAPGIYPGPLLVAMAFNPNPDLNLIASSYADGDLVTFDPWSQRQHAITEANAHTLAASSDGATLATGDGSGTIQIYDFETLRLLYRSTAYDFDIRALAFASSNIRFFDVRGDHCNVWEPSAIVRQTDPGDLYSEHCSEGALPDVETTESKSWDATQLITAMVAIGVDTFLCGKEDGAIVVYDSKSGQQRQELYSHGTNTAITLLEWNAGQSLLASTDRSSRFQVRELSRTPSGSWMAERLLLDQSADQAVRQVLLRPDGRMLLVSTLYTDHVWDIQSRRQMNCRSDSRHSWRWVDCSFGTQKLLHIVDGDIKCFEWLNLDECAFPDFFRFTLRDCSYPPIASLIATSSGSATTAICAYFREPPGYQSRARLRLWSSSSASDFRDQSVEDRANFDMIAREVKAVIGFYKMLLLFLDQNGWICSLNADNKSKEKGYTRHFFVPYSWHCSGELIFAVTSKGSVALARKDGIAIFHRGLDFEDCILVKDEESSRVPRPAPQWRSPVLENHVDSPQRTHYWDRE